MAIGPRQAGIDEQAIAVLHQPVADEAQLRLLAVALALEPGIGIGGAGMGLVARRSPWKSPRRCGPAPAARPVRPSG